MTDARKLTRLGALPDAQPGANLYGSLPGKWRKPGSFNRSKMVAILKRRARAKQPGNKPEPPRVWTSMQIMAVAGRKGFLSVRRSRKVCGYRWATPSKYPAGQSA